MVSSSLTVLINIQSRMKIIRGETVSKLKTSERRFILNLERKDPHEPSFSFFVNYFPISLYLPNICGTVSSH